MLAALLLSSALFAFAPEAGDYQAALAEVEEASKEANRKTDLHTLARLDQALLMVQRFPENLAQDPDGRERRALGQLNLARLHMIGGNDRAAVEAMDRAIFAAGSDTLPADRFGPDLAALHQRRVEALDQAGRATLTVHCRSQCQIYVDGNAVIGDSAELYLGAHQLHVTSRDEEPLTQTVILDGDGELIEYGIARIVEPVLEENQPLTGPTRLAWGKMERPIPRWKLAGVGASGGLFVLSLGAYVGTAVVIGANGSIREDLLAAAEDSLTDSNPANDIDPNSNGDLCRTARTEPPGMPGTVTNKDVTEVCNRADTVAGVATAMLFITSISAASTLTFGLLLNTHREPKGSRGSKTARFLREHNFGMAVVPRLEGGATVAAGLRF
ncbi:MAG: hypothetical protein KC457_12690 [Myxococcales bacterium]|nr:hypothetical protein [Myxococcales bacterium]